MKRLVTKKEYNEWQEYCKYLQQATQVTAKETAKEKKTRIQKLLKDYNAFTQYYFESITKGIDNADFHIDAAKRVTKNKNFRGVFEWARGHAKSTHISLMLPLFLYLKGEIKCLILVNQNEKGAIRLLSKVQAHLENNQKLLEDFGDQKNFGNWSEGEFSTKQGTLFVALGRGQSPRGTNTKDSARPDYIILDDFDDDEFCRNPRRVTEGVKWINEALFGAMDMGRGRFVMVGNRIHKNAALANIVKKKNIYHTVVNALGKNGEPSWSAKYSKEEIEEACEWMGYASSQKEYFNNPIQEGTVFREDWIRLERVPAFSKYDSIVAYVDPSFKSSTRADYKAVAVVGKLKTKYYVLDVFVRQCSIKSMSDYLYALYNKVSKTASISLYMEANFMQDLLLDEIYEEGLLRGYQLPILPDKRKKPDKHARIENLSPLFERGWITFADRLKDNTDYQTAKDQLTSFEKGSKAHDDFPDALEGAIYLLRTTTQATKAESWSMGSDLLPPDLY